MLENYYMICRRWTAYKSNLFDKEVIIEVFDDGKHE